MGINNDPKTIAKLLRAIANAEDAKKSGHDIIFHAAAEMIDPALDADQTALDATNAVMKVLADMSHAPYAQIKASVQTIIAEALQK